jgi:hypothetical protein
MKQLVVQSLLCTSLVCVVSVFAVFAQTGAPTEVQRATAISAVVEPIEVTLERKKIVNIGGKELLVAADVAKPGDTLIEVAAYTNRSKKSLAGFQATLPIPQNTELIEGSAQPRGVLASTDGKSFFPLPLMRRVKLVNGVEKDEVVPLAEYRYLRWSPGEIPAEKTLSFSARFKVSQG